MQLAVVGTVEKRVVVLFSLARVGIEDWRWRQSTRRRPLCWAKAVLVSSPRVRPVGTLLIYTQDQKD